ncbi:hypothetical protein [Streptomyces sp. NPDC093097]|uniref:hypothetical protein n=1 Tax=Streptomyces sp. NPDC093097 TaxID=3366027 RepID=UPI00381AC51D
MSAMSPRERLTIMVRTDRGSMTVWAPSEVREALDAYRAEVLREAAGAINALAQDYECDPGRGDAADLLRRMADVAGKDTPRGEFTRAASVAEGGDANA